MKKQELIVKVVEILKEREVKTSQENVKQTLIALEEVLGKVVNERDEVAFCGLKISTKETAEQTRVHNFGENKGEEYTVPAKIVPTVKFLDSKKKELSKEI